jgi:hypothetical protein
LILIGIPSISTNTGGYTMLMMVGIPSIMLCQRNDHLYIDNHSLFKILLILMIFFNEYQAILQPNFKN